MANYLTKNDPRFMPHDTTVSQGAVLKAWLHGMPMGAFSEADADEFRLCVADEFRSRAGVRLQNLRDIAVQRVDYFERGLTIQVSAAVRADRMGDGWRNDPEVAAAFAAHLERQWRDDLSDLAAQAVIKVAVEVDEPPYSTTGLNPSVFVGGLDDVYRQIEWEEHVRARLADHRYLWCLFSGDWSVRSSTAVPTLASTDFSETGLTISVGATVRGGDGMGDGWADNDEAAEAFARFVEARWRDELNVFAAQADYIAVTVFVEDWGQGTPDITIDGLGDDVYRERAWDEHVRGRLTDLQSLFSEFCAEPAPELLAAA